MEDKLYSARIKRTDTFGRAIGSHSNRFGTFRAGDECTITEKELNDFGFKFEAVTEVKTAEVKTKTPEKPAAKKAETTIAPTE